mgnify:CR=1 FL=1
MKIVVLTGGYSRKEKCHYPQEALAAGISYADLCNDIVNHGKGVLL